MTGDRGIGVKLARNTPTASTRPATHDLKADYVLANPPSTTPTGAGDCSKTTAAGSTVFPSLPTPTSPGCSTSSTPGTHRPGGFVLANGSMSFNQSGEA